MVQRPLDELIEKPDPAWPLVQGWVAAASKRVEVLPVERSRADAALAALQVTTRSPMGAIVHESGGLLVDDGWLRILGSGSARHYLAPDGLEWENLDASYTSFVSFMLSADLEDF